MNNFDTRGTMLINAIIFSLGVTIGFFVGKKKYEEFYENLLQEEIDSVRNVAYQTGYASAMKSYNEDLAEIQMISENTRGKRATNGALDVDNGMTDEEYGESQVERTNNNPLVRSSLDANPYEQAKKMYNLTSKKPALEPDKISYNEEDEGPETDDAGETEESMIARNVFNNPEPYVIDYLEFTEGGDHNDKETVYYHTVDNKMSDETESLIEDPDIVFGYNALTQIAANPNEALYVRNEFNSVDYEIIAVIGSFADLAPVQIKANLSPRERYAKRKGNKPDA
jgi:hypothetical protein